MCIAILTSAHPDYPFVLLSNRDEFLHRPTSLLDWWQSPHSHVLGGRDLYRPVQGTWLGISRQGRIAVLTNFKDAHAVDASAAARSRGAIVNSFLTIPPEDSATPEAWVSDLMGADESTGVASVGGFSLVFGDLRDVVQGSSADKKNKGLAVLSNRTPSVTGLPWMLQSPNETHALSNTHYGDDSWPKVANGESLTAKAVADSVAAGESKDQLLDRLFGVLSVDTLPGPSVANEDFDTYTAELRNSIFIPRIGNEGSLDDGGDHEPPEACRFAKEAGTAMSGYYGTQSQSVILVDRAGKVTFVQRTLWDHNALPLENQDAERTIEFQIENWEQ